MSTTAAHTLSTKSARQRRNVFIWCGNSGQLSIGTPSDANDGAGSRSLTSLIMFRLGVDSCSPVTISTSYRWVTIAVKGLSPEWSKGHSFALFPVGIRPSGVLTYNNYRNGPALSPESQESLAPGDYGIFTIGK
jgi:hypothetical protein